MTFDELKEFLNSKMRMSYIYQPLLIKTLLEAGGLATVRQLAVDFAAQDERRVNSSQLKSSSQFIVRSIVLTRFKKPETNSPQKL